MEIVSIILRLKNQEIKVTVEEAKELLGQLSSVFEGEKPLIQKEFVGIPYGIPYPVYSPPAYPKPWWEPIVVYSNGDTGNISWKDNTRLITSGTTGEMLDSITYQENMSWSTGAAFPQRSEEMRGTNTISI